METKFDKDAKDFEEMCAAWDDYQRAQILKDMFTAYKRNKDFCECRLYFMLWLKALICILLNWRRVFDDKDRTATVCTTDEEYAIESVSWITCEVSRSPFVWGVSIFNDGN